MSHDPNPHDDLAAQIAQAERDLARTKSRREDTLDYQEGLLLAEIEAQCQRKLDALIAQRATLSCGEGRARVDSARKPGAQRSTPTRADESVAPEAPAAPPVNGANGRPPGSPPAPVAQRGGNEATQTTTPRPAADVDHAGSGDGPTTPPRPPSESEVREGGAEPDPEPPLHSGQVAPVRAAVSNLVVLKRGDGAARVAVDNGEAAKDHHFEDSTLIPARLGSHLMSEAPFRVGHDQRLWRYANGVYRPDGDAWARQRTRELVGERFRRSQLEEVCAWLRAQLPSLGHEPPMQFINCLNGLLDWETGTLHLHSRDVLSTNQIPVIWNPVATAPTVARFFAEVLPDDAIELVEELIGYALYPGNPFRKAVMLLGSGANGKSTLLRLVTSLLGKQNVSSVSLQELGENRFAAADLFGKLANICGDLDARAIRRTDLFKQLTGGDPIRGEFKFRDAFSFVSYALPLFSANEAPRTADQTAAWFDRWIILPMERRFVGATDDTKLSVKLAAELEGVLVCAVAGLQRLMKRGQFAFQPSVEAARDRYRDTLDTVRAFVSEETHFEEGAWVDRAKLYKCYLDWCRDVGGLALAAATFNTHLLQAYEKQLILRTRHGRPGWSGLAIGPSQCTSPARSRSNVQEGGRGDEGDDGAISTHVHPPGQGRERGNA